MTKTTYRDSGVSIDAGNELVQRIKKIVSTSKPDSRIGGFSGLFPLPKKFGHTYLAGCCDGVGTKLKIAFLLNKHDTVGIDLVAMNVNDLVCSAAKPLFFLDYFACGKLNVNIAEKVIKGIQKGCEESGCVLLGGETAEMPGFYPVGEYDLAGFALGVVESKHLFKPSSVLKGDLIIGLPSSGLHSNGYSLIRKIFSEKELVLLGKELLTPTRIYVKQVMALIKAVRGKLSASIKGIAHITGGGWLENIPRILPKGAQAEINKNSWEIPKIFSRIQKKANLPDSEMYRTFNMGIGLILIVSAEQASKCMRMLGEGVLLGKVSHGKKGVVFV